METPDLQAPSVWDSVLGCRRDPLWSLLQCGSCVWDTDALVRAVTWPRFRRHVSCPLVPSLVV